MSRFIVLLLTFLQLLTPAAYGQEATTICTENKLTVGFFNGVWNTVSDTVKANRLIRYNINSLNLETPLNYEVFYNYSARNTPATTDDFEDLAEVFIQRAEAIEPNLSQHFELFWSSMTNDRSGFFREITLLKPLYFLTDLARASVAALDEMYSYLANNALAAVAKLVANPPTGSDYQRHASRIKTLANQGNGLLFIAHSQGNLFVNQAYKTALQLDTVSEHNIGVLHVAPPTPELNGDHVLANRDLVIQALRAFGYGSVPPTTHDIPLDHLGTDASGHLFADTYLNRGLAMYNPIMSTIKNEIDRIELPPPVASNGAFTATLSWPRSANTDIDVDLHIYEPSGRRVYYQSKSGLAGNLDVDDLTAPGAEHYVASCNPVTPGIYQLAVNYYHASEGSTTVATVQVSTAQEAELISRQIYLTRPRGQDGDDNPTRLILVDIIELEDGGYELKAYPVVN
jgi:hypothetical protein